MRRLAWLLVLPWLPLWSPLAGCASSKDERRARPPAEPVAVEAEDEDAPDTGRRWSPVYDVTTDLVPWRELPRAPNAIPVPPPSKKEEAPGREPPPAPIVIDGPPIDGCVFHYREADLETSDLALYPSVGGGFAMACGEREVPIAGGWCTDALVKGAGRDAAAAPPSVSPLETMALLVTMEVDRGLFLAARRAGGIEPRALLTELAKRSPRPECWTQAADMPLFERFEASLHQRYLRSRPADPLESRIHKLRRKEHYGFEGLAPDESAELELLTRRLRDEPELLEGSPRLRARWLLYRRLRTALRDEHLAWLKRHGRAPTARELREAFAARAGAAALVDALPRDDVGHSLAASYLRLDGRATSPWVRTRFDAQRGYVPIVGPTRFLDDAAVERPTPRDDQPMCGTCRSSRECAGEMLCTAELLGEDEGYCTRLVDTASVEVDAAAAPAECAPAEGPVRLAELPVRGAEARWRGGYFCEPAPGCPGLRAARDGTKCEYSKSVAADGDLFTDARTSACGELGVCVAEQSVCGVACGEDGACADGLACEELVVAAKSAWDDTPEHRARVCVAPGRDRRPWEEWEKATRAARTVDVHRRLSSTAGAILNNAAGGFDVRRRASSGPLRDAADYGGMDGSDLRFFALDDDARCVVAAVEKRAKDGDITESALPVFTARRIQASVTCDGQRFVPLLAQVCRTVGSGRTGSGMPAAVVPLVLEGRDLRFAPVETIAQRYGESLRAARARVTQRSYDPSCFWGQARSVLDVVRSVQERDTRNIGTPDEPTLWPRYAGWMSEQHYWALVQGEDDADYAGAAGPGFVRPDELDELAPRLRPPFKAFFRAREENVSFVKRALAGDVAPWTGEPETDAARAAMLLAVSDRVEDRSRLVEARALLRRWAGGLDDESRVTLHFALDDDERSRTADERTVARLYNVAAGPVSANAFTVEALRVSPGAALCDLGRRWADDEDWTWNGFVREQPHWYHLTSWAELGRAADRLSLPREPPPGTGNALCEELFAREARPLSEAERTRFGALEAKRLGANEPTKAELVELGALGTRFARTLSDDEARRKERDALVAAHGGVKPLTAGEREKLLALHRRRTYGNLLFHGDGDDYRKLGLRFRVHEEVSLDEAMMAAFTRSERRAHDETVRCLKLHEAANTTAVAVYRTLSQRRFDNAGYPETVADLGDLEDADRTRFEIVLEERGEVTLRPKEGSGIDKSAAWKVTDFEVIEYVGDEDARCGAVFSAATDSFEEVK